MKGIQEAENVHGKKVLVRIDIDDGDINPFPVTALMPTLAYLKNKGTRVILLGHVGREKEASSRKIFDILRKEITLSFVEDIIGDSAHTAIDHMGNGDVVLLENVRRDEREIKNDDLFAEELASLAEIYVNDAFAVSHREHASIIAITKYLPSFAGLRFQEEVRALSQGLTPNSPSLFVLGGAKIETKLPLIEKFIHRYDYVFVGGVLANNFFQAKGFEIGRSSISHKDVDISSVLDNKKILLPVDVVVEKSGVSTIKKPEEVLVGEKIVDAGPQTMSMLKQKITDTSCVLWNGPLGEYEQGFDTATKDLARMIAGSSAYTIVGGGDTLATIAELHLEEKYSFTSTGGGAMLEFLLHGTLPGIKALH